MDFVTCSVINQYMRYKNKFSKIYNEKILLLLYLEKYSLYYVIYNKLNDKQLGKEISNYGYHPVNYVANNIIYHYFTFKHNQHDKIVDTLRNYYTIVYIDVDNTFIWQERKCSLNRYQKNTFFNSLLSNATSIFFEKIEPRANTRNNLFDSNKNTTFSGATHKNCTDENLSQISSAISVDSPKSANSSRSENSPQSFGFRNIIKEVIHNKIEEHITEKYVSDEQSTRDVHNNHNDCNDRNGCENVDDCNKLNNHANHVEHDIQSSYNHFDIPRHVKLHDKSVKESVAFVDPFSKSTTNNIDDSMVLCEYTNTSTSTSVIKLTTEEELRSSDPSIIRNECASSSDSYNANKQSVDNSDDYICPLQLNNVNQSGSDGRFSKKIKLKSNSKIKK